MLVIDGAHGEGGGQILRTALTLSALLTQPIHIMNIRANRKNPGLAPQHLTAVRAAALICDATVEGDTLRSTEVSFTPQSKPVAGFYEFDVSESSEQTSAGATALVLQTILLPLALASESSTVTIRGGTHVSNSPSFHYLRDVYLLWLSHFGLEADLELINWGWYPIGQGELHAIIPAAEADAVLSHPAMFQATPLKEITGLAVASSLAADIAQRMSNRAERLLAEAGFASAVEPLRVKSESPGAGIFLTVEYDFGWAGFAAIGKKGKPSEQVAAEAVDAFLAFHRSEAALDSHMADQILLPLALSSHPCSFSVEQVTSHVLTNIWVIEQFLGPRFTVDTDQRMIHYQGTP